MKIGGDRIRFRVVGASVLGALLNGSKSEATT